MRGEVEIPGLFTGRAWSRPLQYRKEVNRFEQGEQSTKTVKLARYLAGRAKKDGWQGYRTSYPIRCLASFLDAASIKARNGGLDSTVSIGSGDLL
ncbi:hypothetical protein ACOSQ2_017074 [Xanthoceras sorbifolium]